MMFIKTNWEYKSSLMSTIAMLAGFRHYWYTRAMMSGRSWETTIICTDTWIIYSLAEVLILFEAYLLGFASHQGFGFSSLSILLDKTICDFLEL